MTTVRQKETLARVELFASLSAEQIARLDTRCIWRRARAKEWIIDWQDEGTDVFFLVSGVGRVMIRAVSGRETILRDVEAGAFFGELAAIDGQPRSAGILAITDVTIARMTAPTFVETVTGSPEISLQLLRRIAGEVRRLANRINEFNTLAMRERLIVELLRLSRMSRAEPREAIVSPPPVHAELAGRISTRRESVTKELSALEREGLIRRGRGALTLADVPQLMALIGDHQETLDFKA